MKLSAEIPHIKDAVDYDFREALKIGNLQEAEDWLKEEKETILRDDSTWIDELEAELFQSYLAKGDLVSAQRIAENSVDQKNREARLEAIKK